MLDSFCFHRGVSLVDQYHQGYLMRIGKCPSWNGKYLMSKKAAWVSFWKIYKSSFFLLKSVFFSQPASMGKSGFLVARNLPWQRTGWGGISKLRKWLNPQRNGITKATHSPVLDFLDFMTVLHLINHSTMYVRSS